VVTDQNADGTYRWWHLSGPSPELLHALTDTWLSTPGRALDVGCGLGSEAAHLHSLGWQVVGLDLSAIALVAAATATLVRPICAPTRCAPRSSRGRWMRALTAAASSTWPDRTGRDTRPNCAAC